MKKAALALFIMCVCSAFVFSSTIENTNEVKDDLQDKIALSRLGGTTRGAAAQNRMFGAQSVQVEPEVEAYISENVVSISVQNYRGSALVEIIGTRGGKQNFFEVYDMGFEVVSLAGMRAGEYTIRITLGTEVFEGTFKKGLYGR